MIKIISNNYKKYQYHVKFLSVMVLACIFLPSKMSIAATQKLPKLKPMMTMGKIDGESTDKMSIVTVRLDNKPDWKEIPLEDHGSFMQILLPNTVVPTPGEFFEGNSPYIKKIAAFQTTPSEGAIRLFLTEDAATVKKVTSVETLDSRIIITTDHSELKKLLANHKNITKKEMSVANTINPQNQKKDKELSATGLLKNYDSFNFKEKIIETTIFIFLMIFFLIATLSIKPLLRKRQIKMQGDSYVSMNLLSNLNLAPKQKLSLVQVGDEQILLAVSPDSVSFISRVGEKKNEVPQILRPTYSRPQQITDVKDSTMERKSLPKPPHTNHNAVHEKTNQQSNNKKSNRENSFSKFLQEEEFTTKDINTQIPSKRINVQISDDGIKSNLKTTRTKDKSKNNHPKPAVDDVTRIIREKLKNLPNI